MLLILEHEQQEHLLPKNGPVSLSSSILALKYINDIHDMHKIIFLLIGISVFVIVINSPPRETLRWPSSAAFHLIQLIVPKRSHLAFGFLGPKKPQRTPIPGWRGIRY